MFSVIYDINDDQSLPNNLSSSPLSPLLFLVSVSCHILSFSSVSIGISYVLAGSEAYAALLNVR